MSTLPMPLAGEAARLAAVRRLALLETPPEERFDRLTRLAAAALAAPMALLALLDEKRVWFKSSFGLPGWREVPREHSFCEVALAEPGVEILLVPNAAKDRRFAKSALVAGKEHVRAFAGRPLLASDGARVGVLCVMDRQARDFSPLERQTLSDLALLAEQELRGIPMRDALDRLAQTERRLAEQHARFARLELTAAQDAEATMRQAKEVAEAANRAKSQFVAHMSHEVRTPLNGILGVTAMLLEMDLRPEQRQLAEVVMESGEGLLAVVNDVLDFAKIEAARLELENVEFSLAAALRHVSELHGTRAKAKGLELLTHVAASVPDALVGDPLRLRQVLNNLVGNAVKFSESGTIRVTVEAREAEADRVGLCFAIADCGRGIPAEKLESLFEPFTQVDASTTRQFGGTGLGLSISRQLVELLGGEMGVESVEGEGSTFCFTANFGLGSGLAGEAAKAATAPEALPRLRVLLAEDSAINRLVAIHQLHKLGCEVEVVENGEEALAATAAEPFDVALMDCQMPLLDGYAATAEIRRRELDERRGAHLPIVAITANAMTGERERCLALGMDGYLTKPFTISGLRMALAAALPWAEAAARANAVEESDPRDAGAAQGAPDAGAASPPLCPRTLASLRRECLDGVQDHFPQYVTFFEEDAAEALVQFGSAAALPDSAILQRTAHRLRGAAANFGAGKLIGLCTMLEHAAAEGQLEAATALLPDLRHELAAVQSALRQALAS